jgi:diguanylate cyclase (GGDEF)-like protein
VTSETASITRITTGIAAFIALSLILLVPAGYFSISYQYLLGTLDAQSELDARAVTNLVLANPRMWTFEQVRLAELLERRSRQQALEVRRIIDMKGNVVAEVADKISPPLISRSHEIYDSGIPVAKVVISRSLAPIILNSVLVAFGAFLVGIAVFVVLRTLPLRAVRRAYQSLEESERKYHSLYVSMKEGLALHRIDCNPSGQPASFTVVDINSSCERILGLASGDILGRNGFELFGEGMRHRFPEILRVLETHEPLTFELARPETASIIAVSVFAPEQGHFATLLEDITERKRSEERIRVLAHYDNLTGLPNRLLLSDRLDQAIVRAARENGKVAVFFLDLDRFKVVNDTLGHACGDLLLLQVARRLRESLRSSDTLARLGGDEFIILLPFTGEELNAAHVAQHLLDCITPVYTINERAVYTSVSIGIAVFPDDGQDGNSLLRCADMAMYAAKDRGRSGFHFYSEEMNRRAHERLERETSLRRALEFGEMFLEYQPVVSARDGKIVGAEALVRWQHPDGGRIMPGDFIGVAEESGLIVPLGEWVLRTACCKMREWRDAGIPQIRLSVNVSGLQFAQINFVEMVASILAETGADPRCLELELTETSLMENAESTLKTLFMLKELELNIVVDDFGSGYSSLAYLRDFPVDRIKIDRSFVKDVCNKPDDRAIVEAIIAMASSLHLSIVAEGVETEEQSAFLVSRNCDEIQGYYYHRPLSEEKLLELLRNADSA